MQRMFDILFTAIAMLLLSPFLIPVAILLKLTGEGEVFYFQERIGQNGKPFHIYKFATMLKDSPNMANAYITTKGDPRVLPFGKFLRKTKLNELPQLINILKGDISIVGPRPQVKSHLDIYPKDKVGEILSIKPGLTGIASIFFRDEEGMISRSAMEPKAFYKKYIIPYKVDLELWYKKNQGISTYFKIIFLTAWVIVFPKSLLIYKLFKDMPASVQELRG